MNLLNESESKFELHLSEFFYYFFWIMMLLAKGTGSYEGQPYYNFCIVVAMMCLGIKILLTEYKLADLMWMVPSILFGGIVYLRSGDQSALILAATIVGLKDVSLSRVFKIGAVVWNICFIGMVIKTLLGGNTGPILVHEKLGLGPVLRWSLGYTHPNVLQITYVILAVFVLYVWNLKPQRSQWKITAILFIGNLYIFLYSISFTGFLFMLLLLVFNFYFLERKRISKVEGILIQAILPACIVFSLVIPVVTNGQGTFFQFVNKVLNSRYAATIYIRELGLSLWGIKIPSLHGYAVDCSYTEALLGYGLIPFLLLMLLYMAVIHDMLMKNCRKELTIMLALLVAGVSEPFLFNTSFKNLTILFLGEYLFNLTAEGKWLVKIKVFQRKVTLLSCMNKVFSVSTKNFKRLKNACVQVCRVHKAQILGTVAVAFAVFVIIGMQTVHQPDSIFVGVKATDCGDSEEYYLDMKELPDDFNSLIYMYPGAENPMYEFSGNMLKLEYVRSVVSIGVWGSSGVLIVVILVFMVKKCLETKVEDRKNENNAESNG